MTETSELRDFLSGVFKDFILSEARSYLSNIDEFRLDSTKGGYRSNQELGRINVVVRNKAEEMSNDFLDELDVKGISTPEDYEKKLQIFEVTLRNYRDKFLKWLQKQ